ncbi:hypothetical protein K435DRAFT_885082 [Dendrothele bispora CBS 962.96]|uniref:Uncharacterized protein n=1 Tax=Dendrothele bispora (strain CBS 962.96) TaxID=1314807 RepID=A0A4S8M7I9_DENBC|nr:hypothetical protein K435DRAFT_885082 [Dendrothele bispora CBS 962.96]
MDADLENPVNLARWTSHSGAEEDFWLEADNGNVVASQQQDLDDFASLDRDDSQPGARTRPASPLGLEWLSNLRSSTSFSSSPLVETSSCKPTKPNAGSPGKIFTTHLYGPETRRIQVPGTLVDKWHQILGPSSTNRTNGTGEAAATNGPGTAMGEAKPNGANGSEEGAKDLSMAGITAANGVPLINSQEAGHVTDDRNVAFAVTQTQPTSPDFLLLHESKINIGNKNKKDLKRPIPSNETLDPVRSIDLVPCSGVGESGLVLLSLVLGSESFAESYIRSTSRENAFELCFFALNFQDISNKRVERDQKTKGLTESRTFRGYS